MKKFALGSILGCIVVMATGCGAVPEILVETAKSSAKDALDQRVDEVVSDLADEFLDLDQLSEWSLEEADEE